MFDVINGLPLHVLLVHGVVVLLPLMALVTTLVSFRARWRERLGWWVAAADVVVLGLVFAAIQAGKTFQKRLGGRLAIQHGNDGRQLLWFAVALLVVAVLVALTARQGGGTSAAIGVLTLLVAVAAAGWTVRVGDSGAKDVWTGIVKSTKAP